MARNKDNEKKMSNGEKAKLHTREAIQNCEIVKSMKKGPNLSRNNIEKATCDLQIELSNHQDVVILIHSTFSLRDDRLESSNTKMGRLKRRLKEQKKSAICIMATDNNNGRSGDGPTPESSRLFNGYNFGDREDVGIDMVVHNKDLTNVLMEMNNVEEKNGVNAMIAAARKVIKTKNY